MNAHNIFSAILCNKHRSYAFSPAGPVFAGFRLPELSFVLPAGVAGRTGSMESAAGMAVPRTALTRFLPFRRFPAGSVGPSSYQNVQKPGKMIVKSVEFHRVLESSLDFFSPQSYYI